MNIGLVRVENSKPKSFFHVDWKLHNVCNYDCSYCSQSNKTGNQRWLSLEMYKSIVDKLVKLFDGQPYIITLTGGEPTLFPEIIELFTYIRENKGITSIVSNGSRTVRYWKELADAQLLDHVCFSFHSDTTSDYQHYIDILNLFHDSPTNTSCEVLHTKNSIENAIKYFSFLVENTGSLINMKSMYNFNIEGYTPEQVDFLSKNTYKKGNLFLSKRSFASVSNMEFSLMLKVTNEAGQVEFMSPQSLIKANLNRFYGWECHPSKIFRINYDTIYNKSCSVALPIGSIFDEEYKLPNTVDICRRQSCNCYSDFFSTKQLPTKSNMVIPISKV